MYSKWLSAALPLLTFTAMTAAQPTCSVPLGPGGAQVANGSQLCVQLHFDKGTLVVDRGRTTFKPSAEFSGRLAVSPAQAERELFEQPDVVIGRWHKPYVLGLGPAEFAADRAGTLKDPPTGGLRNFTGEHGKPDTPGQAKRRAARVRNLQKALGPLSGRLFCRSCLDRAPRSKPRHNNGMHPTRDTPDFKFH